jgi:tetratricopeptide (TPR) repeat protein
MTLASLILIMTAGVGAPADSPASDQEARALFRRGELNFYAGNYQEALGNYQRAYQVKPLPGFVFNIAQCYRNLGNYERAGFFYRRYLTLERSPARRVQVEKLIDEMAAKTGPGDPVPPPPDPRALHQSAGQPAATSLEGPLVVNAAPASAPIYRRWWFWTTVGVLAAGTATLVLMTNRAHPGDVLPPIDGR